MPNLNKTQRKRYNKKLIAHLSILTNLSEPLVGNIGMNVLKFSGTAIEVSQIIPKKLVTRIGKENAKNILAFFISSGILIAKNNGKYYPFCDSVVPRQYVIHVEAIDLLEPVAPHLLAKVPEKKPAIPEAALDETAQTKALIHLGAWLATKREGAQPASERERSYEIFGDEKMFQKPLGNTGKSLINYLKDVLGIDPQSDLKILDQTKPKFESLVLLGEGCVVISENQDMYLTFRNELMNRGRFRLFGKCIRGAIAGSGTCAKTDSFGEFLEQKDLIDADLLYIGDIDIDGIEIFEKVYKSWHAVPFTLLYMTMLNAHLQRRGQGLPLNNYKERQQKELNITPLATDMPDWATEEIKWCLEHHVRIPQEIISTSHLQRLIANNAN